MLTENDPKLMPLAKDIGDECELALKDVAERCDFGMKFEVCMHSGLKARKIDIDFF